ncbi:DUF2690 domain-containing protein [Tolypothrix campylonemoides VB511288]|nr:DUF2690 domain-containing protein [Tolypothrix campylonemoides VB511288]
MNKPLFSLGLVAIFAIPFAVAPSVHAQNNMDPLDRGCEQDAETLTSTSGGTYRNNLFQTIDVKVELRKSNKCQANWVKAYVPKDTSLYLKDQSGNQRGSYTAKVNGWNYGDMWNYHEVFSACIKLPDGREVCTNPVQ